MGIRKKKLGERIGAGLVQLKGDDQRPQVFSLIGGDVLSYDYHYDDIYNQLGRFMCLSEYDDNGKMVKRAECCKVFKKRQDRVLIPVIAYEGTKKNYRKMNEAKIKYLSITSYKYNDLLKNLDDAGVDFDDANVDILLKSEDSSRGKISFDVIDDDQGALWRDDEEMTKMVKDALETWEDDIKASLPNEYSKEEFLRLIEEAKETAEAPEGVEDPDDIPRKKKSKKKIERDLDDSLDDEDEEDEKPVKKKKKSVKEQLEDEEFDNDELDDEDEKPKKKKKKQVVEEEDLDEDLDEDPDEDLDEDLDDEYEEETPKKKKKRHIEDDEDEDDE